MNPFSVLRIFEKGGMNLFSDLGYLRIKGGMDPFSLQGYLSKGA